MLKYIEHKTGFNDKGPAWIGFITKSKSGRTTYFNGKAFKMTKRGIAGNHYDLETGDEYWISSVKRDGQDRHWAGSGKIAIEAAAVDEYLKTMGQRILDPRKFVVSHKIKKTDPSKFHDLENQTLND